MMVQSVSPHEKRNWFCQTCHSGIFWLAGAVWLGIIVVGFWTLLDHDTDPGRVKSQFGDLRPTLVRSDVEPVDIEHLQNFLPPKGAVKVIMALHPKCPCTRKTLSEFDQLLSSSESTTCCTFLVSVPADQALSWIDSDTVRHAKNLPNSEIVIDSESKYATQLGLLNSGSLIVVQSDGKVLFRGGITSGRTCSANSPGLAAVDKLLKRKFSAEITTPTFGCPLNDSQIDNEVLR